MENVEELIPCQLLENKIITRATEVLIGQYHIAAENLMIEFFVSEYYRNIEK